MPFDEVSVVEESAHVVVYSGVAWLDEVYALPDGGSDGLGVGVCFLECGELELYGDVVVLLDEFGAEGLVGDRVVIVLEGLVDRSDEEEDFA